MSISETTTDDIFAQPPRFARRRTPTPPPTTGMVGRTACAVCGLRAEALICRECAEHPAASRGHVLAWLYANVAAANALLDAWDAARAPQQAAWDAIQDARAQPDFAARCARHRAAGNVYGRLLDAQANYEAGLQPLDIERARLERALNVLDLL